MNEQLVQNIQFFLEKYKFGLLPVCFLYQINGIQIRLHCGKKWRVNLTDRLLSTLRDIVGYDQVKLELR